MFAIPAIDIIDGKCVRLSQGDYTQKTIYSASPLEVAKEFEAAGLSRIHIVDLDGARSHRIVNIDILYAIAKNTNLKIDFGGGVKSDEDIAKAFDHGAHQVTVGSIAVKDRDLTMRWLARYGADRIILGADVRDETIAIQGWQESGGVALMDFLDDYTRAGIQYVICTDIARDGMLSGPALSLYHRILQRYPGLHLIASGGVSSIADIEQLREAGLYGAITGKGIYEGRFTLSQLKATEHAG